MINITIKKGNITKLKVDAIVNPSNSYGVMGGGVALAIKKAGGPDIEREAKADSPIYVGDATITNPGKLPCKWVIHASTMEKPTAKIPVENVKKATLAALNNAEENKLSVIAFPGMGTGTGKIKHKDAAKAMINTIRKFHEHRITDAILIDIDDEMVKAWSDYNERT
jgi:O-acetyl-ADP-ribose deacetylase